MLPFALKKRLPFYKARWRARYRAMLDEIGKRAGNLEFGQNGDVPWLQERDSGVRIFGFWTEPKNIEVYELLEDELPREMPVTHFRLVKDYLNRYVYPHMRPDLKPDGYSVDQMWGFHGQHKDAIDDQQDPQSRARLTAAFRPKPDDVVIDGGAFLGIGDLRMSRDLTAGRIVAIEANRACYELLCRNRDYNKITNLTAQNRALWSGRGTLELDVGYAQANTLVADVAEGDRKQSVETINIDALVEELALPHVSMISLTLNGAEVETLDGAQTTLDRHRPRIRLAGWYTRDSVPIWKIAKEKLERHDYDVFVGQRGNVMALPR
jgi:FkbM family methyltransferase